jgi:hypothetical protein
MSFLSGLFSKSHVSPTDTNRIAAGLKKIQDRQNASQVENVKKTVSLILPNDIVIEIFKYLGRREDLASVSNVCKQWNKLAFCDTLLNKLSLKVLFPSLMILDEEVWQKHFDLADFGMSVKDAPVLKNTDVIIAVQKLHSSIKDSREEIDTTQIPASKKKDNIEISGLKKCNGKKFAVALVTIPKGLNIVTFYKLSQTFSEHREKFNFDFRDIELGENNTTNEKTYTVLITQPLFGKLDYQSQQKSIQKMDGEIAGVLPVLTRDILAFCECDKVYENSCCSKSSDEDDRLLVNCGIQWVFYRKAFIESYDVFLRSEKECRESAYYKEFVGENFPVNALVKL